MTNPVATARARADNALQKMEAAVLSGTASQPDIRQLGALLIVEMRRYAVACELTASKFTQHAREQANG